MKNTFLGLIFVGLFISGCQQQSEELGSRDKPIKMYFTPSVDADTITSNSKEFIKYLEKETGLFFESGIPTSYIAVVEALGSERADIAVMNSFGYLMANEKYGAKAKLTVIRHGSESYKGQIIAHVDSGIKTVKDLSGRNFAFTDPSSTSGYLFPKKILAENQVKLKNTVFATKHDNVVTMIYQRQVDAGATYYSPPSATGEIRDARARVKTMYPDVEDKVKIITTTDPIRNDPFVFRKGLPDAITNKVILAIKKFLSTDEGRKTFKAIYSVEAVVDAKDSDYQTLRDMIKVLSLDAKDLIKKK